MPTKALILNLGPVSVTSNQDYRQFMMAILLTVVVALGLILGYQAELLYYVQEKIGPVFAVLFAGLFVIGLAAGLIETWAVSRAINGIKRSKLDAEALKSLFGIEDFRVVNVELVKEEVADNLYLRMDKVKYTANLAVLLGLFGTAYGLAMALEVLSRIQSTEGVLALLPEIGNNLSVAFFTTLVGIAIYAVLIQFYRLVRAASTELKNRIFRSLHEELQKGVSP